MPGRGSRLGHRAAEQDRESRIGWHRIVLLRGREREEAHDHADPAEASRRSREARSRPRYRSLDGTAGKTRSTGRATQMQQPEQRARDGVVVARIAQVQKAQDVLVEEVEPEEPAITARFAVHREIEIGRIAQRGEHDAKARRSAASRARPEIDRQPLPRGALPPQPRTRAGRRTPCASGKTIAIRPFSSSPTPMRRPRQPRPAPGLRLLRLQRAQQAPHGERDGQRQDDVRNQDAREQPQPQRRCRGPDPRRSPPPRRTPSAASAPSASRAESRPAPAAAARPSRNAEDL